MFNTYFQANPTSIYRFQATNNRISLPENCPSIVYIDFDGVFGNCTLYLPPSWRQDAFLTIIVKPYSTGGVSSNVLSIVPIYGPQVTTACTGQIIQLSYMPVDLGNSNISLQGPGSGVQNWQLIYQGSANGIYYQAGASQLSRSTTLGSGVLATGLYATAIGYGGQATAQASIAFGLNTVASGTNSIAIGQSSSATSNGSVALGMNSGLTASQAATGNGAMALGGSYASGTDSFAAAIANNTSSYGAQGANSVAIGYLNKVLGTGGIAYGYSNVSSSSYSTISGGTNNNASGSYSTIVGGSANIADAGYSVVIGGGYATTRGITGANAFAGAGNHIASVVGTNQRCEFVLAKATTDATPTVLTTNGGAVAAGTQINLPNDTIYGFKGTLACRNTANDNDCIVWAFKGAIARGTSAATTRLIGIPTTELLGSDGSNYTFSLTADTTYGGLAITVTGAAATALRWVAVVQTTELTG